MKQVKPLKKMMTTCLEIEKVIAIFKKTNLMMKKILQKLLEFGMTKKIVLLSKLKMMTISDLKNQKNHNRKKSNKNQNRIQKMPQVQVQRMVKKNRKNYLFIKDIVRTFQDQTLKPQMTQKLDEQQSKDNTKDKSKS